MQFMVQIYMLNGNKVYLQFPLKVLILLSVRPMKAPGKMDFPHLYFLPRSVGALISDKICHSFQDI